MKRWGLPVFLILCLLAVSPFFCVCEAAEEPAVFVLPSSVRIIEEEAFEGTAVRMLILPEGAEEIRSAAFADTGLLTKAYLPGTLSYIAQDAFGAQPIVTVYGVPDSAAHAWAEAQALPFIEEDIWHKQPQAAAVPVRRDGNGRADAVLFVLFVFLLPLPHVFRRVLPYRSMRRKERAEMHYLLGLFP